MAESIKPYKDSKDNKKKQITQMFDNISGGYDQLNRVISLGSDVKWRKKVVKKVASIQPKKILDIATGTGDLAIAMSKISDAEITGLDISAGMLEIGKNKIQQLGLQNQIKMVLGDSEKLPFSDDSFDAITISFGIRNFENVEKGLSEILRVLRKNGILVILETSVPERFPFKQGYHFYGKYILPTIGKLFSKDKTAYSYLSESAAHFPYGQKFAQILTNVGFKNAQFEPQTMGVATIYTASKT